MIVLQAQWRDGSGRGSVVADGDLFTEEGFDRLTFEKVAKRANNTRPAIYRRWDNKAAMVADAIGRLREEVEVDLGAWEERTLEQIASRFLEMVPQIFAEDRTTQLLARFIGAVPTHPELMQIYRRAYLEPRRLVFNRILEDARRRGVLAPEADVEVLQDMFAGALLSRMFLAEPADEDELRDWFQRLLRQLGWLK